METIGYMSTSSVSAKPVSMLRPSSSTADKKNCNSQFLISLSSSKSSIRHGQLQCYYKRQNYNVRKLGISVDAVLMEPTNLNESSASTELYGARKSSSNSSSNVTAKSMTSTNSATVQPFSGFVQEALHCQTAKLMNLARISSFAPDAERLRRERIPLNQLRQGGYVGNSRMYRQLFVIRSYEVGPDKSTSIREIFSLFQEMALNHVQLLGIAGDGFGATREMNRLGLIWVVTKMQVDVGRYPAWPEVIEIDSWVAQSGKNGMRRDWIMRSYQTGEVLARATSTWCMMNGTTRRLSKLPDEVRTEIVPFFMNNRSAFSEISECVAPRIAKLDDVSAEHQVSQLTSTLADLDMNQHVNNLKYINWVLESIPVELIQTHKLASIVLEYRRECHSTDIVESLTSSRTSINGCQDSDSVEENNDVELAMDHHRTDAIGSCCEYTHLLRTQDAGQQEILRGKTTWRSRSADAN